MRRAPLVAMALATLALLVVDVVLLSTGRHQTVAWVLLAVVALDLVLLVVLAVSGPRLPARGLPPTDEPSPPARRTKFVDDDLEADIDPSEYPDYLR